MDSSKDKTGSLPLTNDEDYSQPKLTKDVLLQFEKQTRVPIDNLIKEYLNYCRAFDFDASELQVNREDNFKF